MTLSSRALAISALILVFFASLFAMPRVSHAAVGNFFQWIFDRSEGMNTAERINNVNVNAMLQGQPLPYPAAAPVPAASQMMNANGPVVNQIPGPAPVGNTNPAAENIINSIQQQQSSGPMPASVGDAGGGASSYFPYSFLPASVGDAGGRADSYAPLPWGPGSYYPMTQAPASAPQPMNAYDRQNNQTVQDINAAYGFNSAPAVLDFGNEQPLPAAQTAEPGPSNVFEWGYPAPVEDLSRNASPEDSARIMGTGPQSQWVTDSSGNASNLYTGGSGYDSYLAQTPTPAGASSGNFFTDIGNLFSGIFGGGSPAPSANTAGSQTNNFSSYDYNGADSWMLQENYGDAGVGSAVTAPVSPYNPPIETALPDVTFQPAQDQGSWWSGVGDWFGSTFNWGGY